VGLKKEHLKMDFDFSRILEGGNPWIYLAAGIVILLLARNNKDGQLSNILMSILQQLLNTPAPIDLKNRKGDRAQALLELSDHCRRCGDSMQADQLIGSMSAVVKEPAGKA
jgi:hypothetical protein